VGGVNQNNVDILGIHNVVSLVWSARLTSRGQGAISASLTLPPGRPGECDAEIVA
jgi:hypothetical protein